jgi:hypothetical protein
MVTARAEWGSYAGASGRREVDGPDEAQRLCDEVEAVQDVGRVLVGFTTLDQGHYLGIGIGADDSAAVYSDSDDPPYFQSRGPRAESEAVDYAHDGHHTELSGTVRIPRRDAFAALREFMQTGSRPECLAWDET